MLRTFLEHFNQTLHSNHLIFHVCCFILMFNTTDNDIGDSGAESISRALQSNTSMDITCYFPVRFFVVKICNTTDNGIGDSGAESISRALQSNTSLKSLDIRCVLFLLKHVSHNS